MFSRRAFLRSGGVAAASVLAAPMLTSSARAAIGKTAPKALVIIELSGGNDALNTVIPISNRDYYAARPTLAIAPDAALKLDRDTALHPAMRQMHELFTRGQLAIVQGVGYAKPNRSHFRSMEIWHRATADPRIKTGWLGRWCESAGRSLRKSLVPILQFGQNPAELFRSRKSAGVLVGPREAPFTIGPRELWMRAVHHDWIEHPIGPMQPISPRQLVELTGLDVIRATRTVGENVARPRTPNVQYPDAPLGRAMALFAQMIVGGAGARLMHVSHSGFDTHAQQAEMHAQALGEISVAVGAFLADLRAEDRDCDVLVMVFSEFGRRLRENGSAGTDHGSAGAMFFAGGAVKGGLYGAAPNLSELDDGDLKHTTDFRDCYATVLENWLDADPQRVLGRGRQPIAFLSAATLYAVCRGRSAVRYRTALSNST